MNISFDSIRRLIQKTRLHPKSFSGFVSATALLTLIYQVASHAAGVIVEPVQACIISSEQNLTDAVRSQIAQCLGWESDPSLALCKGYYKPIEILELGNDEVRIRANQVSLYREGRSQLKGNIEVQQEGRIVNAQTAYVYRNAKTNKVDKIELLGEVRYIEADRLMIAKKAIINPEDKSGLVEDVLYRFNSQRASAILPSWGRASLIQRFPNKDYLLEKATYSTCAPQDRAWQIEADRIMLDDAKSTGVARNATLRVRGLPVLYTPYLSFPTTKERKSGFLFPVVGASNVGGFDMALPYYLNLAPNYDATIIPHVYGRRGLMMGGQFRYLNANSYSTISGRFLPQDHAFKQFIENNKRQYPALEDNSTNRWSFELLNQTTITPDLHLGVNFSQVSDNYFLQDFSTNLAVLTERQLLRQADLTYTTENWLFRGMAQSYQTLHPVNETPVSDIYQRLPQLSAFGLYDELPFNANLSLLGQFDYFLWPSESLFLMPEGSRYHLNPVLSFPQIKPWGFFTPSVELVQNNYNMFHYGLYSYDRHSYNRYSYNGNPSPQFNRTIPRYSLDSGLFFERNINLFNQPFSQTLEPRLYYLNVPYHDQTQIPVFDSGYMIFTTDQLFRNNRFSGFDRIGDTNQLSYALRSRFISDDNGIEKANFEIGQIRYFSNRHVLLCQSATGFCDENPLTLGFLSPIAKSSPIASRLGYHINAAWDASAGYVWDPYTTATNNAHLSLHYQPGENKIINFGYTYLVNGDITQVAYSRIQDNPLNQISAAYAWPINDKWSTLGAYNYNISKRYEMMSFFGVQYDSCCWAMRLIGGRAFQSLNQQLQPKYNNNIYFQILLKGLGTVENSDPSSRVLTFLPGYKDGFHR